MSAGYAHTCAVTSAGAAYCWGSNGYGQLGDSSFADATLPVAVRGGFKFVTLTTGFQHSCGLTPSGDAYCWGDNQVGQLGDTTVAQSSVPNPVAGGFTFARLSAGGSHTCGLTTGGVARCWGLDANGQLGGAPTHTCVGATASGPCSPVPQLVTGGYRFAEISAGTQHTCAIATDARVFCWGLNSNGQLGSASMADGTGPVRLGPP